MHNKKILAKGLILEALVSATSVNSMANYDNESNLLSTNNNLNSLSKDKIKKENKVEKSINQLKNNTINSKEVIIVNENIVEGKILEVTLNEGDFISNDLIGNPEGYETIKVTTTGDKKLVKQDYINLRLSEIPKVDLSNSKSEDIVPSGFNGATHLVEFKFPQGITSIGDFAFNDCSGLTGSLVIPDSVRMIGNYAFYNCSGFTGSLVIPDSVASIGNNAFNDCSGLTGSLIIPDSVRMIGNYAFYNCSGFSGNLVISNSVANIGFGTFSGCSGFTGELVIPDSVISIGDGAFSSCSGFNKRLIIGTSVISIGDGAFSSCSGLIGNLVVPNSVTNMGTGVFSGCSGFNGNLIISKSLTSIKANTFQNCSGLKGDLVIPDSVINIESYAFFSCGGFNGDLRIGSSLTSIGFSAFQGCSRLTGDLIIPSSVTIIEGFAFYYCSGFTDNLIIPESVINIGREAFTGCSNIEKILIKVVSSDIDTNYKEDIIKNLPDTSQVVIDLPDDFDISGTWIETTNKTIGKPIVKNVIDGIESDLVNNKGEAISLYIPSSYQESNIIVLKDSEEYDLPSRNLEGKHVFIENGVYQVTITTDLGNISIITFEVEDAQLRDAREAVDNVEISNDSVDLNNARDLVNKLPESLIKEQLQIRLNNIFPNLTLERQTATANLDLYIKSENMLLMSLSTNSITFEDFSGVNEIEKSSAIKISVNSSLPYQLNAYLLSDIKNTDGNNKIDIDRLNIKDNSEVSYSEFNDIDENLVLKNDCVAGNDKEHIIDIKLKGDYAYPADIYKTTIKFEAEQK